MSAKCEFLDDPVYSWSKPHGILPWPRCHRRESDIHMITLLIVSGWLYVSKATYTWLGLSSEARTLNVAINILQLSQPPSNWSPLLPIGRTLVDQSWSSKALNTSVKSRAARWPCAQLPNPAIIATLATREGCKLDLHLHRADPRLVVFLCSCCKFFFLIYHQLLKYFYSIIFCTEAISDVACFRDTAAC